MDCTIFRRADMRTWSFNPATGESRAGRTWVAVCPQCNEEIRPRDYVNGLWHRRGITRKVAKDALYQHMREARHIKPGLVGRRGLTP